MTTPPRDAADLARAFWQRMASNDFASTTELLAPAFRLAYPQSGEVFDADGMVALNRDYPAAGRWRFEVERVVAGTDDAVTDVVVTDGGVTARAVTFFDVADGAITRMVEYWPEPFDPPTWRTHLTQTGAT